MIVRPNDDRGFTLVELLVAMTLLGLVMVLLFGGLRFGMRAWERTTEHTTGSDEIRLAQDFLRDEIGRAYPGIDSTDATHPHVAFIGKAASMDLIAPSRAILGAGRGKLHLETKRHGEQVDLWATLTPELASGEGGAITDKLLSGAATIQISYFGSLTPGEDASWHAEWAGTMRLPKLVRIRAAFPEGDARVWPDLIVATTVTADIACVVDAFTHDCRGR